MDTGYIPEISTTVPPTSNKAYTITCLNCWTNFQLQKANISVSRQQRYPNKPMQETDIKHSFAPIITKNASILILGSIPGDKSIAENEYYAHPRNRFWNLLARLTGNEPADKYTEKIKILTENGISLWDVAGRAVRKGSMDSSIKEYAVNDIDGLLTGNPSIKIVIFNGKTAERFYDSNFSRRSNIKYRTMPSTSPANAAYNMERLADKWKIITQYTKPAK